MPDNIKLPKAYSKGLSWHGCGHALYHPVPVESMRAPCVGYFDDSGKWHLITSLVGQAEDVKWKKSGYTFLEDKPKRQVASTQHWQPKQSSKVYDSAIGLMAGTPDLTAIGIPAPQISIETKWRTASNFGAFLVTTPPVAHENLNDGYNNQYKRWIQENFDELYSNGKEELERYGLWVVTETYTTTACMIQTWTGSTREVQLDLKANAMMAGDFGPLFETSKDRNGGAVTFHAHENFGGRLVVFCDGLRYSFRRWRGIKYQPHLEQALLGDRQRRKLTYDIGGGSGSHEESQYRPTIVEAEDGTAYEIGEAHVESDSDSESDADEVGDDEIEKTKAKKSPKQSNLPLRPNTEPDPPVHVACDYCLKSCTSRYYSCLKCVCDLCPMCAPRGCGHRGTHELELVIRPSSTGSANRPAAKSPAAASVDETRAPDSSTSGRKESQPLVVARAPKSKSKSKSKTPVYTITCDGCGKRDLKRFYRCRACTEFDLCETCYVDKGKRCKRRGPNHAFEKRLTEFETETSW